MSLTFDFSGRVVLITGSSSGIGARTALNFSEAGAQVAITGLAVNTIHLEVVANQCLKISPKNLKPLQVLADVSNKNECKRLIDSVINEFGKLDILVNCAGIANISPITYKEYIEIYKNIFETNLNSVIYLTNYSVEHLEKTNGHIINIASVTAVLTYAQFSAYCMSKCALNMFTKCMAVELSGQHIRVNSILPGGISTNIGVNDAIARDMIKRQIGKCARLYPVGRAGNVDDIANAIIYLTANESSFITGTNFVVDGGHIAGNINL